MARKAAKAKDEKPSAARKKALVQRLRARGLPADTSDALLSGDKTRGEIVQAIREWLRSRDRGDV